MGEIFLQGTVRWADEIDPETSAKEPKPKHYFGVINITVTADGLQFELLDSPMAQWSGVVTEEQQRGIAIRAAEGARLALLRNG